MSVNINNSDLCACLPIYGSTALVDLGRFFSFLIYTLSAGILGRGISPLQGRYLHTEEHKHRIKQPSKKSARKQVEAELCLFFDAEDGGDMFLRNIC
jgi:hypothetical protein